MSVQKEIWVNYIIEALFKNNDFLNYAFNADEYVLAGKVVHIPQAGQPADVVRNRQNLPATIKKRKDVDITYNLDEFTSDPTFIENAEQVELSYDKINSVMQDNIAKLKEMLAEWMLYNWAPTLATSIIPTTGGNVVAHIGTGNRKALLIADLKSARKVMNKANIPKEDRFALIDSEMYDQLLSDANFTTYRDVIRDMDLPNGAINRIHGFNILERSSVQIFDNSGTPVAKTPDDAIVATDNAGVLCWQKMSVERALGMVDFFEDIKVPQYYGNIYSFLARMGGRIRRLDEKGVVSIVQTT